MEPAILVALVIGFGVLIAFLSFSPLAEQRIPLDVAFRKYGVLVGSEVRLSHRSDFSVSGRVDQLWMIPDAGYLLVDTKNRTRAQVYDSDRLQLSIYAWLLRRSDRFGDKDVVETGFVRIPSDTEPARFLPVALLSDTETEKIIQTAFARADHGQILNPPRCYRCGHCGHYAACQPR